MKRDIKGIYKRFKEGKEKNIVGIDIPWNPPLNFDLKINMDKAISIKDTMNIISKKLNIFWLIRKRQNFEIKYKLWYLFRTRKN